MRKRYEFKIINGRKVKIPKRENEVKPAHRKKKSRRPKNKNYKDFYKSHKWAKLRYEVLKESDGRCSLCGRSSLDGVVLNVDHIKPKHKYPKLAFKKSNLQVLCSACNWGKYGDDETDWRTNPDCLDEEYLNHLKSI